MTTVPNHPRQRPVRRASLRENEAGAPATRESFVASARVLLARSGPRGMSIRDVAAASHRSHALVSRYFGSKAGLVDAVAEGVAAEMGKAVEAATAAKGDPVTVLLGWARRNRVGVQLLIRCGLGDLRSGPLLTDGGPLRQLVEVLGATPTVAARSRPSRSDVCAYAAASLVLGWLTFDRFITEAARLTPISRSRRDDAIAMSAHHLSAMAVVDHPEFRLRRQARNDPPRDASTAAPEPGRPGDARTALIDSAMQLYSLRGPAAVTTREIAHHAHVNHGLVHRHFGSKDTLIAEAIDRGSASLFPVALAVEGFDLDAVIHQLHHESLAPRLIARTLVDDIDIGAVRTQFPVLAQLLAAYDHVPTGSGSADLSDPRVAVAAGAALALGSAIWGPHLRCALKLSDASELEGAVADVIRVLLAGPAPARPVVVPV